MADRPILFSVPMVRAILAGTKTQTRRITRQPPPECSINFMLGNENWLPVDQRSPVRRTFEEWSGDLFRDKPKEALCGSFQIVPRFQPGDRLWVRETWAWAARGGYDARDDGGEVWYRASDEGECDGPWKPRIHMRRSCSRLTLIVTDVRVQRIQDISADDVIAEGCPVPFETYGDGGPDSWFGAGQWYENLWNEINGAGSWAANPWVVALTFDVVKANIDALPAEASDGIAAARPLGIGQREADNGRS